MPDTRIITALNNAEEQILNFKEEMTFEEKIKCIQLIGINIRTADKVYFKNFSDWIKKQNPFERVKSSFVCENCYSSSLSGNNLRNSFKSELVVLSDINNNEIIHAAEKGKMVQTDKFLDLVRYFKLLTSIDLTGYPAVNNIPISICKDCRKK